MVQKISTDPKIVKMFRRLERFLDQEGLAGGAAIDFINAETWRKFATFIAPEVLDDLLAQLDSANETIAMLEDEGTLLALIDAQNDVLMGRLASAVEEAVDFPPDEKCGTFHVEGLDYTEADASPDEDYPEIMIPRREYEELLNLRRKRTQDKKTITELNAKVTQYKRASETFNRQRDSYLAQLLEAKSGLDNLASGIFTPSTTGQQLFMATVVGAGGGGATPTGAAAARNEEQEWAFIGGIRGVGFPDLEEFHAFTSDAIRD